MATLTDVDHTWIKNWLRGSQYADTIKQSGLSKAQVYDACQAIEDYSIGSYSVTPTETLRDAINAATGTTPTTLQNQALWYAWSAWKADSNRSA